MEVVVEERLIEQRTGGKRVGRRGETIVNTTPQLHVQGGSNNVRPRSWHLEEKHFIVDNGPISVSLLDCSLYFFNNAKEVIIT